MRYFPVIIARICRCEAKPKQSLFLAIIVAVFLFSPSILLADAEKVFRENSKAVVVIISYDSEGNPIGQGSGFVVRENGVRSIKGRDLEPSSTRRFHGVEQQRGI